MAAYHHSPVNLDAIFSHCRNGIPAPKPSRCSDVPISRTIIPTVSCTVHPPFLWPRLTRGCPKHRKLQIPDTTTPERRVGATGQRNPTASGPTRPSYPTTLTSSSLGRPAASHSPFSPQESHTSRRDIWTVSGAQAMYEAVCAGWDMDGFPNSSPLLPSDRLLARNLATSSCIPKPSAIQTSRPGWAAAWRRRSEITCLHMGHILSPPNLPRTGHWKS